MSSSCEATCRCIIKMLHMFLICTASLMILQAYNSFFVRCEHRKFLGEDSHRDLPYTSCVCTKTPPISSLSSSSWLTTILSLFPSKILLFAQNDRRRSSPSLPLRSAGRKSNCHMRPLGSWNKPMRYYGVWKAPLN
jgi:hypothetical protein